MTQNNLKIAITGGIGSGKSTVGSIIAEQGYTVVSCDKIYYQLLKEGGRLAAVLPESVFDTTENKYIRLFIYKYFNIKAVVSLPQSTFAPFTNTKTSILFAQKKTSSEIEEWNSVWKRYSTEYSNLKTRIENLVLVNNGKKKKSKLPSIKEFSESEERELLNRFLKAYIQDKDNMLSNAELI